MLLIIVAFLILSTSECFLGQNQNFKDLKLIFINGSDTKNVEMVELNDTSKIFKHSNFHNDRPTMLYGYGYTEKFTSLSTQTVVKSYIERGDHNILVVEWSNYSDGNYVLNAIPNSYKVGEIIGKTLLSMKSSGFRLENFHLVGHSLGGHLVGFIGRSVQNNSNQTVRITRITALDPAGPLFYGMGSQMFNKPLKADDAMFVDVIHTDHTFFGAPESIGDADFWPNEGKDQPCCPSASWDISNEENFCSHRRSWAYYSESVRSKNVKTFDSVSCQSWEKFTQNSCATSKIGVQPFMGIDADPGLAGDYFLQTNSEAPFNRGNEGKTFSSCDF